MTTTTLTIISLNLWAGPQDQKETIKWMIENVVKTAPDILLFQEVSNSIVLKLTKNLRKINHYYKVSNIGRRSAYEIVSSRLPILESKFSRFSNSGTNRGLFWASLRLNGETITIASSQLEQGDGLYEKRIGQLECLFQFLENRSRCSIVGCNTGFLKGENYNVYDLYWEDAWISSGRNKYTQYTVDSFLNKNVGGQERTRPDRIYYQGAFDEPVYTLIGTDSDQKPSKHFGIKLTLRCIF